MWPVEFLLDYQIVPNIRYPPVTVLDGVCDYNASSPSWEVTPRSVPTPKFSLRQKAFLNLVVTVLSIRVSVLSKHRRAGRSDWSSFGFNCPDPTLAIALSHFTDAPHRFLKRHETLQQSLMISQIFSCLCESRSLRTTQNRPSQAWRGILDNLPFNGNLQREAAFSLHAILGPKTE